MGAALKVREEFRRMKSRRLNEQEKTGVWEILQHYSDVWETWKHQKEPDICEVITRLLASEIVAPLDFYTEEGTAVFWTGFTLENSITAETFAKHNSKMTMEMTKGWRFLCDVDIYNSPLADKRKSPFGDSLFAAASERFANTVRVYG
jgi:hypothetical protein